MKLSEQIKNCLDGSGCKDCESWNPEIKVTCRGLLQKAYERINGYEDTEERKCENMENLIICETDRGRYAVRPMDWAGMWNEKGQIKEHLNHLALFLEKEDAENFVKWKAEKEQGKLLELPVAVGDKYFTIETSFFHNFDKCQKCEFFKKGNNENDDNCCFDYSNKKLPNCLVVVEKEFMSVKRIVACMENDFFGKTVFLTKPEAESALQKMNEMEGKEWKCVKK